MTGDGKGPIVKKILMNASYTPIFVRMGYATTQMVAIFATVFLDGMEKIAVLTQMTATQIDARITVPVQILSVITPANVKQDT